MQTFGPNVSTSRSWRERSKAQRLPGSAASPAVVAARIGKSFQSVYREIARNRKPSGCYQPWYAHNQACPRRRRPKTRRLASNAGLREAVALKLLVRWSPGQMDAFAELMVRTCFGSLTPELTHVRRFVRTRGGRRS